MIMPVYITEISPKAARGMLGSLIGPGYAVGVLMGIVANIGFAEFKLGWRVASAIEAVAGLVYAFGMMWMLHTPRCLLHHGVCDYDLIRHTHFSLHTFIHLYVLHCILNGVVMTA